MGNPQRGLEGGDSPDFLPHEFDDFPLYQGVISAHPGLHHQEAKRDLALQSVKDADDIVEKLAHPERFGGTAEDSFDVVVPSLPGFAFSGTPRIPSGRAAPLGCSTR